FLEFILDETDPDHRMFQILTPRNPAERGCQLSIYMKKNGRRVFEALTRAGVVADWREPDVIRVAPVPLYNTFEEVFRFGQLFRAALS
ncbi:MAG TPA: kynureninase, partial [Chryseosolibacter sp.]|nr:kynureninase [Chryseosolibacter sp.]